MELVFPLVCNCSFRNIWLTERTWMIYNINLDGVFCIACELFASNCVKGKFVSTPFQTWLKKFKSTRVVVTTRMH